MAAAAELNTLSPSRFVEAMTLPMWQAMAAVRWLEGRVRNRPKTDETSDAKKALTDGDCVSQEVLLVALREHFPGMHLFVEEDTPSVADFPDEPGDPTTVIDPIDGTLLYLRGGGMYAILVGLEREERVDASLVALPQSDLLLRAVRGKGAEVAHAGGLFAPAQLAAGGSRLLVSAGLQDGLRKGLEARGHELIEAAGGAIGVAPLLEDTVGSVRLAGTSDGLSRRAWVAALPLLEAGGCIEALEGRFPDRWEAGVSGLITAATPASLARLREAL